MGRTTQPCLFLTIVLAQLKGLSTVRMLGSFHNTLLKTQREVVLSIFFNSLNSLNSLLIFSVLDVMKYDTLQRSSV